MGAAQAKARAVAERVVLDGRVEPTKYDVEIAVNLAGSFLFTGTCKVSVVLHAAGLRKVTLHQKELHVRSASFAAVGGAAIGVSGMSYDYHDATVTLAFKSALPAGPGVLTLDYIGHHNDQMAGFYRSEYKDRSGRMATMVSTQFESLDARRCFPCVDEPGRKAVFKAALVVDDGLTALSNMPVESSTLLDDGKRRRVVFQETPRMSTYLLAFAVADFDYVEARSSHGVHVRVYTPPNSKDMGQFSLDVAVAALDLYDDQFKLPYPLPKLDMVAVPVCGGWWAGMFGGWGRRQRQRDDN
jgi:aminopeptidase N